MGCTDSRTKIPDEERAIIISAKNFGFNDWSSQAIDYNIRKYSTDRLISRIQLENIIQNLRLAAFEQSKSVNMFYKSYDLHQTSELDFVKFVVTGIMLGCDPPGLKAKLLFEVLDVRAEGQLSRDQIKNLLEIIVSVSFDHIPLVVDNERNPPAYEEAVTKYISKINRFRENLLKEMENIFLNEKGFKLREFVKMFEQEENEGYVSDTHLRMICYKLYVAHRRSRKLKRRREKHRQLITKGQTPGKTVVDSTGNIVVETLGNTTGNTPGNTVGETLGNTTGYTPGETTKYTQDETSNANPGDSLDQAPADHPSSNLASQTSSSQDESASPRLETHSEPDPIQV